MNTDATNLSENLTREVLDSFSNTPSERLKEIMSCLVTHLHQFAREIQLTQDEWFCAMDFLRECGDMTSERRHEFILLSDVLGLSMAVVDIESKIANPQVTASTVFGPFYRQDSPLIENGASLPGSIDGIPLLVSGKVTDVAGNPIPGALIEIWESDGNGTYDVERSADSTAGRGRLYSAQDGSYSFRCVKPSYYSIATDGPVGMLLRQSNRSPMRPAHVHFKVSADGFRTLVTHIFERNDPYLTSDAVFGVKESLIVDFVKHHSIDYPDKNISESSWYSAEFSPVLQRN